MNNREFRGLVIQKLMDYCNENQFEIKTNKEMSKLEGFDFKKDYDEDTLYWICSGTVSLEHIKLRESEDKKGYVLIDNKCISLMIDNNFRRLTLYPSDRFNQTLDRLLKESENLKTILEFMITENYMISEFYNII